jgi:uncharacterized protein
MLAIKFTLTAKKSRNVLFAPWHFNSYIFKIIACLNYHQTMPARTLTIVILLSTISFCRAQNKNFIDVPYLETTATVDSLVIPDRIFFNILVNEKDAKGDMTFEQLQVKMEETLKSLGINTAEELELVDLVSNFKKYFLKPQDILKTKLYSLLVKDATTAGKVIVALEGLGISNVSLQKFESSKEDKILLTLKARAIKRSKQFADVMANELGQSVGPAIFISDEMQATGTGVQGQAGGLRIRGAASVYQSQAKYSEPDIQFEKIKFQSTVYVKYRLEGTN